MDSEKTDPEKVVVTIQLDRNAAELLKLVAPAAGLEASAGAAVIYIIAGFVDGLRRPGSWERQCVYQFFGNEFSGTPEFAELMLEYQQRMRDWRANLPRGG